MARAVLGALSPQDFLRRYWQKRPLLLRQAMRHAAGLLTPDDLAGLACEEAFESRLVLEKGGERPWQLKRGPFTAKDLANLPAKNWSLLVQGLERELADMADLLADFQFVPSWRLDDVMVSLAPDGGSVGPHLDRYDVFLVQIYGKRRWDISSRPLTDDFHPDYDLRILRDFKAAHSYVLEPGDMLYLPPHFGHHGVAVGECMTLSIGFRAPNVEQLWQQWLVYAQDQLSEEFYTDPDLKPAQSPGLLTQQAQKRLRQMMATALDDEEVFENFLVQQLSMPRTPYQEEAGELLDMEKLRVLFKKDATLIRREGLRFIFTKTNHNQIKVGIEGHRYHLSNKVEPFIRSLDKGSSVSCKAHFALLRDPKIAAVILEWLQRGFFQLIAP